MILNDVIADARVLLQDSTMPYRYSDAVLLGFANQALRRTAVLRPDLFASIGDITLTANTVIQTAPSNAFRLMEIFSIKDGASLLETNREALDQATPGWPTVAAGTPVNWMRHTRNPLKFFVYPRPSTALVLTGEFAAIPSVYTGAATVDLLPDAFRPAVVDCTVFLAQSIDNEHVLSGRAKLFLDSFTQALGISTQSRSITDTENAGLAPQEVL